MSSTHSDSRSDVQLEGLHWDVKLGIICVEVGRQVVLAYDLGNWCCVDGEQLRSEHGTLEG